MLPLNHSLTTHLSRIPQLILLACLAPIAHASTLPLVQEFVPPPDAGWIDVTTLGVRGDGVTDNSPILANFKPSNIHNSGTFFFPDGVYLFSDTLYLGNKRAIIQGQSRDKTILRLKERSPGYDNPHRPKPFVSYHNRFMDPRSNMGQAFRNSLYNITIEVGAGNPGAVAVHYLNNNQGTVENVRIRSLDPNRVGRAGLGLVTNWPGPALIRGLEVEGFDFGIWSTIHQYSITLDQITLRHQREAGIRNAGQALFIRRLLSENRVPALINTVPTTNVVLVDSNLTGGDRDATAIENFQVEPNERWTFGRFAPGLFVRNTSIQGYGKGIISRSNDEERSVNSPRIDEFSSHNPQNLGSNRTRSLNLPWQDPPHVSLGPPSSWKNIRSFTDQEKPEDWGPILQAAIDSGAEVIYFPRGTYPFNSTVQIKAPLRAILGMDSTLATNNWSDPSIPLFRIGPEAGPVILFDRIDDNYGKAPVRFEHATANTLIIKNSLIGGYRNTVPRGTVHLLDVCGTNWAFTGQNIFASQLNPEANLKRNPNGFNVRIDGGQFIVLGIKTEFGQPVIEASNGARVEVLGGWSYHSGPIGYLSNNSFLSLIGISTADGHFREALVREIRDGQTKDLLAEVGRGEENLDGAFRKHGTLLPLYLGW